MKSAEVRTDWASSKTGSSLHWRNLELPRELVESFSKDCKFDRNQNTGVPQQHEKGYGARKKGWRP